MHNQIDSREEFSSALTDISAVFWQFHLDRLKEADPKRKVYFASERHRGSLQPFVFGPGIVSPNFTFLEDVTKTTNASWIQFFQALGYTGFRENKHVLRGVKIPEAWEKFLGDTSVRKHLQGIVEKAEGLMKYSRSVDALEATEYKVGEDVVSGIGTGITVGNQLELLFGNYVRPELAIAVANIDIRELPRMEASLGMEGIKDAYGTPLAPSLEAVSQDPHKGLRRDFLGTFRDQNTLGCPAGEKPSKDIKEFFTREFERVTGVRREPIKETVIGSFQKLYHMHFNTDVREPFLALPEWKRKLIIRNTRERTLLASPDGVYGIAGIAQDLGRRK